MRWAATRRQEQMHKRYVSPGFDRIVEMPQHVVPIQNGQFLESKLTVKSTAC
jgi:hypothetical protein